MNILNITLGESNDLITASILALACFRVWLEIMGFDFNRLPLTKRLGQQIQGSGQRIHRFGLWMSIGTIIFTAPSFLLS
ncbi:MAG: hypothetical protein COW01_07715 [Bdellovibrionales bacterium CG12_big_fil_rev_8_21_14_0_65_38_15]|nr:MAG: hypothetical protein COW79_11075 [Bdellovibrionales bacterium CG22_combo_CG10-13_8_21_14_all_38_13]PIQ55256.1 MAG: hypothetical protein COW01_07715 [Bdellovibrionales bacterium CG12_big_fil_rev_8_21_14_0_65_38_15]PIR30496.1 MAG: hypothetical protein COV38_04935 [Bdellovibrionales bacterium CG11_big_fil_rev_8_21_14_0_20_38_13]